MEKLDLRYDIDYLQVGRSNEQKIVYKISSKSPFAVKKEEAQSTYILAGYYKTDSEAELNKNFITTKTTLDTIEISKVNAEIKNAVQSIKTHQDGPYTQNYLFDTMYMDNKSNKKVYLGQKSWSTQRGMN
jgi:hypothetical protein